MERKFCKYTYVTGPKKGNSCGTLLRNKTEDSCYKHKKYNVTNTKPVIESEVKPLPIKKPLIKKPVVKSIESDVKPIEPQTIIPVNPAIQEKPVKALPIKQKLPRVKKQSVVKPVVEKTDVTPQVIQLELTPKREKVPKTEPISIPQKVEPLPQKPQEAPKKEWVIPPQLEKRYISPIVERYIGGW